MPADLTVVYYTSNREDADFEGRIRLALLEAIGDTPLISVSQQPIGFGQNICVGDVGVSGHNIFRQYQIGVEAARTTYVCPAESDTLYPSDYVSLRPSDDRVMCCAVPVYLVHVGRPQAFYAKRHSEAAMVVNRDHILGILANELRDAPLWKDRVEGSIKEGDAPIGPFRNRDRARERVECKAPIVTFRTAHQTHRKTSYYDNVRVAELPGWGSSVALVRRFYG